jgi:hypothetical protein
MFLNNVSPPSSGQKNRRVRNQREQVAADGFFYPEDGSDTFFRNVGSHKIYTAPHPKRRNYSSIRIFVNYSTKGPETKIVIL